jgi:phosphatidylserine/phosphatidylglycerophosphate/cardiolipin synthase-like enzyme
MTKLKIVLAASILSLVALACGMNLETLPFGSVDGIDTATPGITPSVEEIPLRVGYGARVGSFEVYFTDPFNPAASEKRNGPDSMLAAAIDSARQSVDVAAYSMSLWSIRDALINANKRGLTVRVVMESDNMDSSVPEAIMDAGIPIVGDRRVGLMHDKFVVLDRSEVWTGSMNFTVNGAYADDNNLLRLRSTKVAQDYTTEFNEMFDDDKFGPDVVPDTPNPLVTIDGTRVEIYFSPDDGVARRINKLLEDARQSIYFLAYSFTSDDFGQTIRNRAEEGVTVEGVMEEEQVKSNKGTEFDPLSQAGLKVRLDGNEGLMHHKVFIIDERIVITGSYNFSASAETSNDENVVILFNPAIAAQYLGEFQRVYDHGQK